MAGSSGSKFIAGAIDCLQMPRACRVRLKLLPELEYLVVDGARRRVGVIAPHITQQLVAAEHTLWIFGEKPKQLELMGGERYDFAALPGNHLEEVDLAISKPVGGDWFRFAP